MFENGILREEVEVRKAFNDLSQISAEEHSLKMEIAIAVSRKNLERAVEIEQELKPIIAKRVQSEEKYLRLKVKSAVASREFIVKSNRSEDLATLKEIILPIFDEDIREAKDKLNHHLENSKENREN